MAMKVQIDGIVYTLENMRWTSDHEESVAEFLNLVQFDPNRLRYAPTAEWAYAQQIADVFEGKVLGTLPVQKLGKGEVF